MRFCWGFWGSVTQCPMVRALTNACLRLRLVRKRTTSLPRSTVSHPGWSGPPPPMVGGCRGQAEPRRASTRAIPPRGDPRPGRSRSGLAGSIGTGRKAAGTVTDVKGVRAHFLRNFVSGPPAPPTPKNFWPENNQKTCISLTSDLGPFRSGVRSPPLRLSGYSLEQDARPGLGRGSGAVQPGPR